eukprot:788311-Rhodomonas_salina.2
MNTKKSYHAVGDKEEMVSVREGGLLGLPRAAPRRRRGRRCRGAAPHPHPTRCARGPAVRPLARSTCSTMPACTMSGACGGAAA